jgi:NAD(P)-dependent dehydrogenase (short-subunit alcohol dehydrogenase family)
MDRRVVLVTGGANGIGWATSRRFAASGDLVVVLDRDGAAADARARTLGDGSQGLGCDISNAADVRRAVDACIGRHGRIDVLINNAGVIDDSGARLVDQSLASFRSLMAVNLSGTYGVAQAVGREMLRAGRGAIVNVASCAGFVATPYRSGYGASKAGIMALTQTLAREWEPRGVHVTGLAPGYIRTDMVDGLIASGKLDPAKVGRCIPLGRMGRPEEMAEVMFHLASDAAGALCGTTVVADGGFLAFGGSGDASEAEAPEASSGGQRSVVVAGGAQGVGLALACLFAVRGDRVMVFDTDTEALALAGARLGAPHLTRRGSTTDEGAVGAMVEAAVDAWGGIDVLITANPTSELEGDFEDTVDAALAGAFTLSKAAGPWLLKAGGAVVTITAGGDEEGRPCPDWQAAATAGLLMLTRSLACEWGPQGVRVNAVTPGRAWMKTPHGTGEIAEVVAFLASPAASYVSGATLEVGGG